MLGGHALRQTQSKNSTKSVIWLASGVSVMSWVISVGFS